MDLQALHPKFVTDSNGVKTEVILPIDEFLELLEDLDDLAVVAKRQDEPTGPFSQVIKDLDLQDYV